MDNKKKPLLIRPSRTRAVPGSGTGGDHRGQGVSTCSLYVSLAGVPNPGDGGKGQRVDPGLTQGA